VRALLLHHPYVYPRFEQDFVDRIAELPEFDVAPADLAALSRGAIAGADTALAPDYDAVILFVAFRALRDAPALDWGGFGGLRVLLDHDIIQNYSDIFDPRLKGAWPEVFHRHRFDSIVTSGRAVQARLQNEGIAADWVAKGFESSRFWDRDGARSGIVTYGSAYACRVVAERAITEGGIKLMRLPMTSYLDLGAELARHLACLAISSDLEAPPEMRSALTATPAVDVSMRPGLEPMAKFFEGAASGCCPVADAMDDLEALGFRDAETAITFASHAELVDKLRAGLSAPDKLRAIGIRAAQLANSGHSWAHRAGQLRDAIARRL